MTIFFRAILTAMCVFSVSTVFARSPITMYMTADNGQAVGTISVTESAYGLLFTPDLHDLTPGAHGFHLHEHAHCEHQGAAAGAHFDPNNTKLHLGPYNDKGHLGDLPVLFVNADGTASTPILAPRLRRIKEIEQHALMIHQGGDNYSDTPEKLGGGGARMVCGTT